MHEFVQSETLVSQPETKVSRQLIDTERLSLGRRGRNSYDGRLLEAIFTEQTDKVVNDRHAALGGKQIHLVHDKHKLCAVLMDRFEEVTMQGRIRVLDRVDQPRNDVHQRQQPLDHLTVRLGVRVKVWKINDAQRIK